MRDSFIQTIWNKKSIKHFESAGKSSIQFIFFHFVTSVMYRVDKSSFFWITSSPVQVLLETEIYLSYENISVKKLAIVRKD